MTWPQWRARILALTVGGFLVFILSWTVILTTGNEVLASSLLAIAMAMYLLAGIFLMRSESEE